MNHVLNCRDAYKVSVRVPAFGECRRNVRSEDLKTWDDELRQQITENPPGSNVPRRDYKLARSSMVMVDDEERRQQ